MTTEERREYMRAYNLRWRQENREKIRAYMRQYMREWRLQRRPRTGFRHSSKAIPNDAPK